MGVHKTWLEAIQEECAELEALQADRAALCALVRELARARIFFVYDDGAGYLLPKEVHERLQHVASVAALIKDGRLPTGSILAALAAPQAPQEPT